MSEFNNRIDAQRRILRTVNSALRLQEELYGLSVGALERWSRSNGLGPGDRIVSLLHEAAGKLFFLSNKSQEQITEEYSALSVEVDRLALEIKDVCSVYANDMAAMGARARESQPSQSQG